MNQSRTPTKSKINVVTKSNIKSPLATSVHLPMTSVIIIIQHGSWFHLQGVESIR